MQEPAWAFLTTAARLLTVLSRAAEGATIHTAQGVLTVVDTVGNTVFFDVKAKGGDNSGAEPSGPS